MFSGKKVLVFGLSLTGISSVKALSGLKADITVLDNRDKEALEGALRELSDISDVKYVLGVNDIDVSGYDLIVKSPGIKPDLPIFKNAETLGVEVVSDLELAYRLGTSKHMLVITGTNGKTTTSSLVAEIIKKSGKETHLLGNIGVGMLNAISKAGADDYFVLEASSFQLEHTKTLAPEAAIITNVTPDHLDWHGSFESYFNAKKKVYTNQTEDSFVVINLDDECLSNSKIESKGKVYYVSKFKHEYSGTFVDKGNIVISDNGKSISVMEVSEIKLLGEHNLENVLCAIAMTYFVGVSPEIIREAVSSFKGVEHRIEFVRNIGGVKFYNDSKGTNPDSTMKAINAIDAPIVLIAGGYDKGVDFDELSEMYHKKVYLLILMGATAEKMRVSAVKSGFTNIEYVDNMKEAVKLAYYSSEPGTNVLLSPACASWGMYNNFEERGRDFKDTVNALKERL